MVIYVDLTNDSEIESWGTSPLSKESIKVTVGKNHPILNDIPSKYELINGKIIESKNSDHTVTKEMAPYRKMKLSEQCRKYIVSGFYVLLKGNTFKFSYDLDNQQNFTDTMRLFENSMIDEIGWNAYLNDEKVRIKLNKEEFKIVYLAGIKHKSDCLATLNDYLIPMVDSAETLRELEGIVWSNKLVTEEFSVDDRNTLSKKAEVAEKTGKRNTNGILELTNLILSESK